MQTKPLHVPTTTSALPSFYLTLPQAAALLGLPAGDAGRRRLTRLLLDREQESRVPILIRRGGEKRPRYYITIALLEEHCPELFSRRVQLTEAMQEEFERIESKLSNEAVHWRLLLVSDPKPRGRYMVDGHLP